MDDKGKRSVDQRQCNRSTGWLRQSCDPHFGKSPADVVELSPLLFHKVSESEWETLSDSLQSRNPMTFSFSVTFAGLLHEIDKYLAHGDGR